MIDGFLGLDLCVARKNKLEDMTAPEVHKDFLNWKSQRNSGFIWFQAL